MIGVLNSLYVILCALILVTDAFGLTTAGRWAILISADIVLTLAILDFIGGRKSARWCAHNDQRGTQVALAQVFVFSLTFWFGLYLAARSSRKAGLRYAGFGLVAYAFGLGYLILEAAYATNHSYRTLALVLPALFWLAAIYSLSPDVTAYQVNRLFGAGLALTAFALAAALLLGDVRGVGFVPLGFAAFALISVARRWRDHFPAAR